MRTPSTLVLSLAALLLGTMFAASSAAPPTTIPATSSTRPALTRSIARPALRSTALTKPNAQQKYIPATPQQVAAMEAATLDLKKKTETALKIHLAIIETDHFRIVTNWDEREYTFLKENVEAAYAAVSAQFNIPVSENIFVGKLPCVVFNTYGNFEKFSSLLGTKVEHGVQAYYVADERGYGLLVSHKPEAEYAGKDHQIVVKYWKWVLTHEMTHAFVARYISDRIVDTWLNEGIAETIAANRFPTNIVAKVQEAARKYNSLDKLFVNDDKFRSADLYPVMRTLTELLVKRDKKAFLKMFEDIKNGKTTEGALQDNFKMNYEQLEAQWRRYVGVPN